MMACWLKAFTAFAPVSVNIAYYPLFYLGFTVFYPFSVNALRQQAIIIPTACSVVLNLV
jgi:hypothetical protein